MKKVVLIIAGITIMMSFSTLNTANNKSVVIEKVTGSSFSLINDTKGKVSIYTGTGFVTLNKGAKTSIGCNIGKEVRWADSGRKGDVIFEIKSSMCGKTLKLSELF